MMATDALEAARAADRREIQLIRAEMLREQRRRELDHCQDNMDLLDSMARTLNGESDNYLPLLAEHILSDRLTDIQRHEAAVLMDKHPILNQGYSFLQEYFESLGKVVFR